MADILPFKKKRTRRIKHARETVLPRKRLVLRLSRRFIVFLLLVVVSVVGYVYNSNLQSWKMLKNERDVLESEVVELKRDIREMEDRIEWLKTYPAVESEARRRLNLVRPGERLLKQPTGESQL